MMMTCSIGVAVLLACAIAPYGLTLTSSAAAKAARRVGLMRSAPPKLSGMTAGPPGTDQAHGDGSSFARRRCQIFVILIKILSFTISEGLLCALRAREGAILCRRQQRLRRIGEAAACARALRRGGRCHAAARPPRGGSKRNRSDIVRRGGGRSPAVRAGRSRAAAAGSGRHRKG